MKLYSHTQLSTFESCPLRYKLHYLDRIQRDMETIESFLGNRVHETLKKCYDCVKFTRIFTLDEMLAYYDTLWQKNWHEDIVINNRDLTADHYRDKGRQMLENYYRRHYPFDQDITIETEMSIRFSLDDKGRYRLIGYIDRLARTPDGTYSINDYKTSAHLPSQHEVDKDRQLALYQIGIQNTYPDIKNIRLTWHYLAFDTALNSRRSPEALNNLATDTMRLIDQIEATEEFLPTESELCGWCEYPDLCPCRKHYVTVEPLPVNEFLNEPGVVLVNKYAELKEQARAIDEELEKIKEALIEYARKELVTCIRGSDRQVRIKFEEKLKFPGKNDAGRGELENVLIEAGKWEDFSQLDTSALIRAIKDGNLEKELADQVMQFSSVEETTSIHLSKLKDTEE